MNLEHEINVMAEEIYQLQKGDARFAEARLKKIFRKYFDLVAKQEAAKKDEAA